ncbi:MAG TPA: translocation/assembly module TamB domain-containing protein, partial [Myxococcaceae bacterium]|nr:translocation/assembly module TamB domain-containing protein [Myxococcaceae bacterium]
EGLRGVLSLNLSARGTLDAPEVKLTTGMQQLGLGPLALGQGRLHYTYADARSTLDALLTSENGGTLLVRGQAPQALSLELLRRGVDFSRVPLEADVVARRFDMSTLSGALPLVRSLRGELRADGRVAGTFGAPTWQGALQWKDGRLALDGYGEYQEVQVALDVTDQRLELKKLSARSGGGTLELTARANRTASGQFALTGQGRMRDFPLVYDDQLLALLTLRTELQGDVSSRFVNLHDISIPEARVTLPEAKRKDLQSLDRPEGIVLVRDGVPVEKRRRKKAADSNGVTPDSATGGTGSTGGSEEAQRRYLMKVNAPKNRWVRGADVNAELGLSPDFTIDYEDETAINGTVKVLRGELEVLGRRFDVQRSSEVRFTGPPRKPYINATAEHENESAGVKVFVTVRGQGKDFTLKPTSEPALTESEIYTLLATGRRTLKAGSGASMNQGQVASVLGSLLASQARKALAQKLPLDVLSIEAGEEGLTDARLEVGKYLTDELYLGYNGRLGTASTSSGNSSSRRENDHAVCLEYQFSPRWGIEAEYGDAQ